MWPTQTAPVVVMEIEYGVLAMSTQALLTSFSFPGSRLPQRAREPRIRCCYSYVLPHMQDDVAAKVCAALMGPLAGRE